MKICLISMKMNLWPEKIFTFLNVFTQTRFDDTEAKRMQKWPISFNNSASLISLISVVLLH